MNKEQYKAHFRQRLNEQNADSSTKNKAFGMAIGGAALAAAASAAAFHSLTKEKDSAASQVGSSLEQGVYQPKVTSPKPVTTTLTTTPTATTSRPVRPITATPITSTTTPTSPRSVTPATTPATTPPMFPSDGKAVTIHGGSGKGSQGYDMRAINRFKQEHPEAYKILDNPVGHDPVDYTYPLDHPTNPGVNIKSTMGIDSAGRPTHETVTVTSPKGSSTGATPHRAGFVTVPDPKSAVKGIIDPIGTAIKVATNALPKGPTIPAGPLVTGSVTLGAGLVGAALGELVVKPTAEKLGVFDAIGTASRKVMEPMSPGMLKATDTALAGAEMVLDPVSNIIVPAVNAAASVETNKEIQIAKGQRRQTFRP